MYGTCMRTHLARHMQGSWGQETSLQMIALLFDSWTQKSRPVATHAREVRDFWHVLFGLPTNLTGDWVSSYVPVLSCWRFSERRSPSLLPLGHSCWHELHSSYEKHFHEDLDYHCIRILEKFLSIIHADFDEAGLLTYKDREEMVISLCNEIIRYSIYRERCKYETR